MAKYNDDLKQLDLPHIDQLMLKFWEENDIFNKSVNQRPVDNSFVFYEGPPSANGCRYSPCDGAYCQRYLLPIPDDER
ncbi:MAG: hypothetical protein LC127_10485 [Chitinophagales bacterium]|nr:hypothetical protein [Chitinophagales bacterium]